MENIPELIKINSANIDSQHLCCAISDRNCRDGYLKKKEWLKKEMPTGYTFCKADVKGKVFIEYCPLEQSWLPVKGSNFMVINCFWVSGKFSGQGLGTRLLNQCFEDAKEMDGVIAITADKKQPFMMDPLFLKKNGFRIIDTASPNFLLWCKSDKNNENLPRFAESARHARCNNKNGIVAYYSNTCPFTEYYTNNVLSTFLEKRGIPYEIIKIDSREKGLNMPVPWIINSIFYMGELLTLEILSQNRLEKLI